MVHAALKRYGHNVPSLDEFIDSLDELKAEDAEPDELNPTEEMASTIEPSPSLS